MPAEAVELDLHHLAIAHGLESAEGELVEYALSGAPIDMSTNAAASGASTQHDHLQPMFGNDEQLAPIKFGLMV